MSLSKPDFYAGNIVRISLQNFLTYERMQMTPAPMMNFIVGPNGTGKSTFLCAVVLGMSQEPAALGRSRKASDYIKRGKDSARIEIELHNPNGANDVIVRTIEMHRSQWLIKNKVVNYDKVSDVLRKYNINVNNLCQVLPQDRVQDFAKMNAKQLLEAVVEAVGPLELRSLFQKMLQIRQSILHGTENLGELQKNLKELSQYLKRMEGSVRHYRERLQVLDEIQILKKKKAWLQFDAQNSVQAELSEEVKQLSLALGEKKKHYDSCLIPIRKEEKAEERVKLKSRELENEIKKLQNQIIELGRVKLQHKSGIEQAKNDLASKLRERAELGAALDAIRTRIAEVKSRAPQGVTEHSLKTSIHLVDAKFDKLKRQLAHFNNMSNESRMNQSHISNELAALVHKRTQKSMAQNAKMELVAELEDVHKAFQWLSENRNQFIGPIYGPIFYEVNITSPDKARYLEDAIPFRDLVAFVCEHAEDVTNLLKTLRDGMKLKVNVVQAPQDGIRFRDRYQPPIPLNEIKKLGFTHYLADLIDGPEPVLSYLCHDFNLHSIPLGGIDVDELGPDRVHMFKMYYSKNFCHRTYTSRYSSNISSSMSAVRPNGKWLAKVVDVEAIDALDQQIQMKKTQKAEVDAEMSRLAGNLEDVGAEIAKIRLEKRKLSQQFELIRSNFVHVRNLEEELAVKESSNVDIEREQKATQNEILRQLRKIGQLVTKEGQFLKDMARVITENQLMKKELEFVARRLCEKQKDAYGAETEWKKAKAEFDSKQTALVQLKVEVKNLLLRAKQLTDGLGKEDPQFAVRFKKEFQKLPNKLDEIRDEIAQKKALANSIGDAASARVIEEYEKKKKEEEALEAKINMILNTQETAEVECGELLESWNSQFERWLAEINDKFVESFESLGCSGTVELDRTENPIQIEKYGLNIRVKFRNDGNFKLLNAQTQSGGERALTTAVFLLSLQKVISVPFRFVDEINQGMDEYNELRVYKLIMDSVKVNQTGQFFLISPKLLYGLEIQKHCSFHIINVGEIRGMENWSFDTYYKSLISQKSTTT